ncbi:MAG: DUF1573 domain-containing protein [Sediminibacterium sp.]|nr:DUF1573 domain-containing protein [Sediminibacterium sp.]
MMKSVLHALVIASFSFSACKNNSSETKEINTDMVEVNASASGDSKSNLPEIKFEEEIHDFGKITQGEKISFAFKFKNTGDKNLIISGASGSCGCTVPNYPKEPIPAGGEGKIDVLFNSEGKSGLQEKTVTLITNCEPSTRILKIKTEVVIPESLDNKK